MYCSFSYNSNIDLNKRLYYYIIIILDQTSLLDMKHILNVRKHDAHIHISTKKSPNKLYFLLSVIDRLLSDGSFDYMFNSK